MRGRAGSPEGHGQVVFVGHRPEMVSKSQGGKSSLLPGRWLALGVASGNRTQTFEAAFGEALVTTKGATGGSPGDTHGEKSPRNEVLTFPERQRAASPAARKHSDFW